MSPLDLADVAEHLPYPLGLKLQALRAEARQRAEGQRAPGLAFSIAAFNGLSVRLGALVCLQAYVKAGATDNAVNQVVVDSLRQPADGAWREVTLKLLPKVQGDVHGRRVAQWFAATALVPPTGEGWEAATLAVSPSVTSVFEQARAPTTRRKQPPKLPKLSKDRAESVGAAMADLVTLRNALVHGTPPTEEQLDLALLHVESIARAALAAFAGAALYVREGERAWKVMGHVPQPMDRAPDGVEDGVPTLVFADGTPPLPLSPLLRFRPGAGGQVDVDELFFVNAAALERLHYIGFRAGAQADGKELGTYEVFKAFWQKIPVTPSPKDPVIRYDELSDFHAQYFVGRGEVLEEIATSVAGRGEGGRYVELRALAGMGKSAILARLYARQARRGEGQESPLEGAWAFHFCAQTEGREYALVALRSIGAQLCDQAGLKREQWLTNDLKEFKEKQLPSLLAAAAQKCGRVVVVIDALDEATGAAEDVLGACLPEFLPESVSIVTSWRVDAKSRSSRVDAQLARIPAERRKALATANPLAGLERSHLESFLAKVHGARVPAQTVEAAWKAATAGQGGADPFFLRFVAEGVRDGRVDLERAETVPSSLEDAFEGQWLSLPTDKGFLAQRVLLYLGILREYGSDQLLAELIARDPHYQSFSGAVSTLQPQDVALVRQGLGKLLVYDGERYGLFHDRFKRFLVGEQKDPIAEALGRE